jgi:lipoate-protein ligase A
MPADGPPTVSWSTVASPALVLGRLAADPPVDRAAARAEGVEVVRRSSGGGPVLWDEGLLALDVVLPPGHRLAGSDVVEAYRWLGEAIAAALRSLGVEGVEVASVGRARAAGRSPGPAAGACFGGLSPYEVLVGGRKVVGLSQARRRPGALLQAGILLRLDAARLARLLGRDAAFAGDLAAAAAGLNQVRPGLAHGEVGGAVDAALAAAAGARLEPGGLTEAEAGA